MAAANNEFFEALSMLEHERGITAEYLIDKIKAAIVIAVKKNYEVEDNNVMVEIDPAKLRPVEIPVIRADISKLQQDTGWTPEIPLEQTIAETLDVWKQQLQK